MLDTLKVYPYSTVRQTQWEKAETWFHLKFMLNDPDNPIVTLRMMNQKNVEHEFERVQAILHQRQ